MWPSSLSPPPQRSTIFNFHRDSNDPSNLPICRIVRSAFAWFHVSANGSDIAEQPTRPCYSKFGRKLNPYFPASHRANIRPTPRHRARWEVKKILRRVKNRDREGILSLFLFPFKLFHPFSSTPCKFFQLWHDGTRLDLGNLAVARVSVDRSFDRFLNELYRLILSILYFRYFWLFEDNKTDRCDIS